MDENEQNLSSSTVNWNSLIIVIVTLIIILAMGAFIYDPKSDHQVSTNNISSEAATHADSLVNVEQNKVIGDLKFGMNRAASEEIIEAFKKDGKDGRGYYLGNCKVEYIKGYYYNDSLYEVEINGMEKKKKLTKQDAEMETVFGDIDDFGNLVKRTYHEGELVFDGELFYHLSELIESKYGKPLLVDETLLSLGKIVEYKPNPYFATHSVWLWTVEKKRIVLNGQGKTGNVILTISLPNVALMKSLKLDADKKHITDSIANTVFK